MLTAYKKILALLRADERRRFWLLVGLVIFSGMLEVLSIGAIFPFLALLSNPEIIQTNNKLHWVYTTFDFQDVQTFQIFVGVGTFLVVLGGLVIKAGTFYMLTRFATMRSFSISSRLLQGYLHQPYVWFLSRNSSDIGKMVLAETQQMTANTIRPAMQLLSYVSMTVVLIALLFLVQPLVALASTGIIGLTYLGLFFSVRNMLSRIGREMMGWNKSRFRLAQESTGGIKDVKLMGLEETYIRLFNVPAQAMAEGQATSQLLAQMPRFLLEGVAFGSVIGLLLVSLSRNQDGFVDMIPTIGLFAFAGLRLLPAMQQIFLLMATIRTGAPLMDKIHEEMAETWESSAGWRRGAEPPPLPLLQGIKLEDVRFSYPGSAQPVLNGLDLEIAVGTTVGIVGSTGAGKTTAIDIILGLLAPESGRVIVDGVPLDPKRTRAWQRNLGYVPQHIYLSDDTVRANIAFGVPPDQVNQAAVEGAARMAALHDFITTDLDGGYDTVVGERGVRLSGGQRQRIGIARALYHDPAVLIMDEATSALDNLTEQAIVEAVQTLARRKTVILIAHRLTTVEACDRVVYLEHGQVSAEGTYQGLLEKSAGFRAMAAATGFGSGGRAQTGQQ